MNWLQHALRDRPNSPRAPRCRPEVEVLEVRTALSAAPAPVYTTTFDDAVTGDNGFVAADGKRYFTVDAGADVYQEDVYERPTAQTYKVRTLADGTQRFGAEEYYANLDIVSAQVGYDDDYLYVSIDLYGLDKYTSDGKTSLEGLAYRYGFRLSTQEDGGGGFLVVADQPQAKNGTTFGGPGVFVYQDVNGDVGGAGLGVTKQDVPAEVNGNGYERVFASDGRVASGAGVVLVRVNPNDPTVVEFALDYKALGFSASDLANLSLEFEANKGLKDPANYRFNDEYTKNEAGSPYRATHGDLSKSEFGTQGLGNIYELDTLRGGPLLVEGS